MTFVAGVVLGAVFVASGLLKVRDPAWPASAQAFGAPAFAVPVLPWAEIAVGVLLGAQVRAAAVAALALLAGFTWLVALHLHRGDSAPCACFGRASTARPATPAHLVGNVVLMGLAVVALT